MRELTFLTEVGPYLARQPGRRSTLKALNQGRRSMLMTKVSPRSIGYVNEDITQPVMPVYAHTPAAAKSLTKDFCEFMRREDLITLHQVDGVSTAESTVLQLTDHGAAVLVEYDIVRGKVWKLEASVLAARHQAARARRRTNLQALRESLDATTSPSTVLPPQTVGLLRQSLPVTVTGPVTIKFNEALANALYEVLSC